MYLTVMAGDLGPKWLHVSLRAMVLIARSPDMMTSTQLSEKLGCENTYLKRIMKRLAENHLIETFPGRYGGYRLARSPAEITLFDVYETLITAVPTPYYSVPSTGAEYYISLIIAKGEKEFRNVLSGFSIEDLLDDGE